MKFLRIVLIIIFGSLIGLVFSYSFELELKQWLIPFFWSSAGCSLRLLLGRIQKERTKKRFSNKSFKQLIILSLGVIVGSVVIYFFLNSYRGILIIIFNVFGFYLAFNILSNSRNYG